MSEIRRRGSGDTVANVEFETPVKGPKQVHKPLPRPVGARPGVQKPPVGEDDDWCFIGGKWYPRPKDNRLSPEQLDKVAAAMGVRRSGWSR